MRGVAWRALRDGWMALPVAVVVAVVVLAGAGGAGAAAQPNDSFGAPVVLAGGGGSVATTTSEATKEMGEPAHAGDVGGASLWFSWTPTASGNVSVDSAGSGFDTLLAVYTGGSVGALTLIASDDDAGTAASTSRACFGAVAGTTYRIAVDGYAGETGSVSLNVGPKTDNLPCAALPPVLGGAVTAPHVGDVLSSTGGSFIDSNGTLTRQWLRCSGGICSSIAGATGASYTVVARDVGTVLSVDNVSGSANNSSALTGTVAQAAVLKQNGRIFWSSWSIPNSNVVIRSRFLDGSSDVPVADTTGSASGGGLPRRRTYRIRTQRGHLACDERRQCGG